MPRNGSGTYSAPTNTWNPAVNGVTATTVDWQAQLDDLSAALTASVAKDGQTAMTGNLPMGGNRTTGMAAAVAITDAANANDVQSGRLVYLTGAAASDAITASLTGFTAYAAGNLFGFVAGQTNTGACTLNINAVGAKAITKYGTTALRGGEIRAGQVVLVEYDGTRFQLLNPMSIISGTAQATTSGTSIDFTSIPAYVKRITLQLVGVSGSGTSPYMVQIGISSGVETSGYLGAASQLSNAGAVIVANFTTGFGVVGAVAAGTVVHGAMTLTLVDATTNTWAATVNGGQSNNTATFQGGGSKSLAGTLDRIRLTTVGGADTFDAGSVNILYE